MSQDNTELVETEDTLQTSSDTEVQSTDPVKDEQTFTQKQVDKIVSNRLKDERKKFSDYETLKTANTELTEKVTTLESQLSEANKQIELLSKTVHSKDVEVELKIASTKHKLDYDTVIKLLDSDSIRYDDEQKPTNINELVRGIVERYPGLVNKQQVPNTTTIPKDVKTEEPQFSVTPVRSNNFFSGGGVVFPSKTN